MLVCIRCGTENQDGTKFCSNCQAALPQIPAASQMPRDPEKIMDRYHQVEDAVNSVKSGEWTMEEYAEYLENMVDMLAQKEEDIRSMDLPDDLYDEFAEELEVGFEGMAMFIEGVNHLLSYVDDQNGDHLDYGLELCYQGGEKVNEAISMNKKHTDKLKETIDTSQVV